MSHHDRGAFGYLLAAAAERAKTGGDRYLRFEVDLLAEVEDARRWVVSAGSAEGIGRTGEEALRRFVETHIAPSGSDA